MTRSLQQMRIPADAYRRSMELDVRADKARTVASPAPADSAARVRSADSAPLKVTVSDEARALASQSPGAGPAKVAALRASVESGAYRVDARALAARIVEVG